jgi:hypothetical protein
MGDVSGNFTTVAPTAGDIQDSNKDILLISASCAMAVATLLLILLVYITCISIPSDPS